jgi:hypothetical protein
VPKPNRHYETERVLRNGSSGMCYAFGVPRIVGVHGIAQQFKGGYELGSVWYDGIRDGLRAAGHEELAQGLAAEDVRVSFFGNLFRPGGAMAASDPPYTAADLTPGEERDLLRVLYEAAVKQDPSLAAPAGAMAPGREAVQFMLARLLRSRSFAGIAERAMVGNLKQVTAFLSDRPVKDKVMGRVHDAIDASTCVLVGHSLGSVVAYEYLCRYSPPSVRLLVTLGSPLGIPNLVFERLTPAPIHGKGAWPGTAAHWVNVADANDIVAMRKRLADLFGVSSAGEAVADRSVENGGEPHSIARYLNTDATGSALASILT